VWYDAKMELPDILKPFQAEAESYLAKGLIGEIEFSGGTYQVQLHDVNSDRDIWTFLQLDENGALSDYFCDDEEEEELAACVHLCAAYLRIYNGHETPLHHRFERSLWNQLGRLYADRLGDNPRALKRDGRGCYSCHSTGGKLLFSLKATDPETAATLKEMLRGRQSDTEETSLKFSNLSQEELTLWREGRPSAQLKYELSYWNDLAKLLMVMQDAKRPYKIQYGYSDERIPNLITVIFDTFSVSFYISEANLAEMIPFLATVKSDLQVYDAPEEEIKGIIYNKSEGALIVQEAPHGDKPSFQHLSKKRDKEGKAIGRWIFVPSDGFYAKDPHWLIGKKIIPSSEISQVIKENVSLIRKLLVGTVLHEEPVTPSYTIAFDNDWNLHLTCYLFSPGDLSLPDSRFLGEWAYIDDDGFYRLEEVLFSGVETIVSPDDLPDFITKHKTWLNIHEGFHVHPLSVEAHLLFEVSDDNRLSFIGKLDSKENLEENRDFGPWVYLAGQGFYSKETISAGAKLRAGLSVLGNQIPLFIKVNREELIQVNNFFSPYSPVEEVKLEIQLDRKEKISLSPIYEVKPEYVDRNVRFFDDFTFVPKEGFHELPPHLRLPERYSHYVEIESGDVEFFLLQELPTLQRYIKTIDRRLITPTTVELISTHLDHQKEASNTLEYIATLRYQTELGSVSANDLWAAIKRKKKFLFSAAGLFCLSDKRFDWLRWLHKGQVDQKEHAFKLSTIELMRLNALDEISIKEVKTEEQRHSLTLLQALVDLKPPEEPILDGLSSSLRPYQKLGVEWLWFLHHYGLSGLLCDDMGLGKTHQTMALMAALFNEKIKLQKTSMLHMLVVCPTSVIYHWQEKLAAYLPNARIYTFYGSDRSLEGFHQDYDILLTSYGICRIENQLLKQIPFELAVFDEVQLAKNHNSRLHATLLDINARMRIGLTGTPIENHLRELKALFDIALPLYMPTETDYREYFIKPIEKNGDQGRKKLLSRMIKPFVMRRRKQDVLVDLPDKTEEISHCDLSPMQVRLYNEVLQTGRARIFNELQDESAQIPYIHIFSLLSGLKQICDHPAVYLKNPANYKQYTSGKWDLFVELLSEARESQQKVVVYSQYLMMLDIIEGYLSEMGVGFASIRGATINRGEQLRRFQQDPSCEVFVGSLQAAGLGIDLTAASVVIHYDRWWNAARENQATDRVHRIGQTRGVQVFKLVKKDTFEERIDRLIAQKGQLMEDIVGVDDHEIVKRFTRQELMEFLEESKTIMDSSGVQQDNTI
jgi:superfamily II DNA or RNA helicase